MIFGSVCSGIEAASVAWAPLGWSCAFVSEIDEFPQQVLRHHYGSNVIAFGERRKSHARRACAPWNFGDFTTIRPRTLRRLGVPAIDVLVGGTPCQSFSIAGQRAGLDDPRGNLTLEFLVLVRRLRPRWVVWENVPGVLSIDEGRTFGAFLGALGQLRYGLAYRVCDAQFFGVPQRRRRVFVVGHLGAWQPAAAVLFEPEGLRGDPPPSRAQGQRVARPLANCAAGGSGYRNDPDTADNLVAPTLAAGGNRTGGTRQPGTSADSAASLVVAHPLLAKGNCSFDSTLETYVTHSLRADGFDASEDGTGRGTPLVPVAFHGAQDPGGGLEACIAFDPTQITHPENRSNPQPGGPAPALAKGAHVPTIAFDCKASGRNGFGVGEEAPTLRAMGHANSHQNAGGQIAVAIPIQDANHTNRHQNGLGVGIPGDPAYTVQAAAVGAVASAAAVRRLTPRECERLQGFPDNYTAIPRGGGVAADGPRYKALGNSMAVPVMRWIGQRIDAMDKASREGA